MLTETQKQDILIKAQHWFSNSIATNHIKNTEKLSNPSEFNINPFLVYYLANFLTGNSAKESLAKALVYPRALGTSITTTFGNHIQKFASSVLDSFGSTTSGIDIEFIDQIDGKKKYCQMKSGPDTINKDDVITISNHLKKVITLARTNNQSIGYDQLVVGVVYGHRSELNSFYKILESEHHHPIHIGKDFWHRLTGDENFYRDLAIAIGEVAAKSDYSKELEEVIDELAKNLEI